LTLSQAIHTAETALNKGGVATARLDAELLLSHVLRKDRTWIFTHAHDDLDAVAEGLFRQLIERRSRREPLQYLVGTQEFWGLEFKVTPDVLIPRPETEIVVEAALAFLQHASATVFDLCTGSGCIAVSIARQLHTTRVFAADRSGPALAVARENARKHGVGGRIRFLEGDLFQPFEELDLRGQADVITANPPYVKTGDLASLQPEVRDFEPEIALTSGPTGTEIHQRIITEAAAFLAKGGTLIMEMGIEQAERVSVMAEKAAAYARPEILKDLAGIERVIILRRK
jgi:release factor glutamine methyltransferase